MTRPPQHILDYFFILNVLEKPRKPDKHVWDSHLTSDQRLHLIFNLHAELLYPVLSYLKKRAVGQRKMGANSQISLTWILTEMRAVAPIQGCKVPCEGHLSNQHGPQQNWFHCQVRELMIVSSQLDLMILKLCSNLNHSVILNWLELGKNESLSEWYGNTFLHLALSTCWHKTYHHWKETTTFPSPWANHASYWLSCSYNVFSTSPACTASLSLPYVKSVYRPLNSNCSFSHWAWSRQASKTSSSHPATSELMLIPDSRGKTAAVTRRIFHAITCWTLPRVSTLL